MGIRRLPVAPRPYRDELLTYWLERVACRYGLVVEQLASPLVFNDAVAPRPWAINATGWTIDQTRLWAQACGLDPARLQRLALAERYPRRSLAWFTNEGPEEGQQTVARLAPVCFACFDADHAADRDGYLRASWVLAEHCVCPMHHRGLRDRVRTATAISTLPFACARRARSAADASTCLPVGERRTAGTRNPSLSGLR
jgi:hypothetical protein